MLAKSRLLVYGVVGVALLIAAFGAPAAWATPRQSILAQTVPTKTPVPPPVEPTELPPPPPSGPTQTALPPASTSTPAAPAALQTPESAVTSATCPSAASLSLTSDRQAVWPGASVVFTATLSNTGRQPLTQVVFENRLGPGLDPVAVLSGTGSWQGRTLRVAAPSLAPGKRLEIVYSARVGAAASAPAVTASAMAASAGCPPKLTSVALGMPPSQLPATGGQID